MYPGYFDIGQTSPWQPWSGNQEPWQMPPTSSDHLQFNFMSPSPLMVNIDSVKCSPPAQEVPCLPSPAAAEQETCISSSGLIDTCLPSPAAGSESGYSSYGGSYAGSESTSSSYNVHQSHSQHILQQPLHVSPSQLRNVSPPSSPESDDSVFLPETDLPRAQPPRVTLPPINLKNNTSFTEAELKAITPWRNALIERLLANQSRNQISTSNLPSNNSSVSVKSETSNPTQHSPPNQNLFSTSMEIKHNQPPMSRGGGGRQRQGRGHARGQMVGGPPFHDVRHLTEFDFGSGPAYEGRICHGTTPYIAISGCIKQVQTLINYTRTSTFTFIQANQGTGTVRAVVETILKYCLPTDLSQYSLTGKSLQEKKEIRNGMAQSRVIMSESGSSKLSIPPQLISGISNFLKIYLTPEGMAASGCTSVASYTRKLISKSCSRYKLIDLSISY